MGKLIMDEENRSNLCDDSESRYIFVKCVAEGATVRREKGGEGTLRRYIFSDFSFRFSPERTIFQRSIESKK